MKILQFIIISILMLGMSCSIMQNEKKNDKVTISGTAVIHRPYCGGAYPPPELANGTDSPMQNTKFYVVKKGDTLKKTILKLKTDNKGTFKFRIKKGSYWIFTENKMLPFDKFYNNNSQTRANVVSLDINCYKQWYNTPNYKLEAKNDTTIRIIISTSCFTGINPCLQYTGPRPQ